MWKVGRGWGEEGREDRIWLGVCNTHTHVNSGAEAGGVAAPWTFGGGRHII